MNVIIAVVAILLGLAWGAVLFNEFVVKRDRPLLTQGWRIQWEKWAEEQEFAPPLTDVTDNGARATFQMPDGLLHVNIPRASTPYDLKIPPRTLSLDYASKEIPKWMELKRGPRMYGALKEKPSEGDHALARALFASLPSKSRAIGQVTAQNGTLTVEVRTVRGADTTRQQIEEAMDWAHQVIACLPRSKAHALAVMLLQPQEPDFAESLWKQLRGEHEGSATESMHDVMRAMNVADVEALPALMHWFPFFPTLMNHPRVTPELKQALLEEWSLTASAEDRSGSTAESSRIILALHKGRTFDDLNEHVPPPQLLSLLSYLAQESEQEAWSQSMPWLASMPPEDARAWVRLNLKTQRMSRDDAMTLAPLNLDPQDGRKVHAFLMRLAQSPGVLDDEHFRRALLQTLRYTLGAPLSQAVDLMIEHSQPTVFKELHETLSSMDPVGAVSKQLAKELKRVGKQHHTGGILTLSDTQEPKVAVTLTSDKTQDGDKG